jgi:hypothetical protein
MALPAGAVGHVFEGADLGGLLGVEFPDLGGEGVGGLVAAGGGFGVAGGELGGEQRRAGGGEHPVAEEAAGDRLRQQESAGPCGR